jgi:hypothetical protein
VKRRSTFLASEGIIANVASFEARFALTIIVEVSKWAFGNALSLV